jgi:hypothetical protein
MSEQFDPVDPDDPRAVVVPQVEPTGVDAIDQALTDLGAIADADVNEHAAAYEAAHSVLRETLTNAGDA